MLPSTRAALARSHLDRISPIRDAASCPKSTASVHGRASRSSVLQLQLQNSSRRCSCAQRMSPGQRKQTLGMIICLLRCTVSWVGKRSESLYHACSLCVCLLVPSCLRSCMLLTVILVAQHHPSGPGPYSTLLCCSREMANQCSTPVQIPVGAIQALLEVQRLSKYPPFKQLVNIAFTRSLIESILPCEFSLTGGYS